MTTEQSDKFKKDALSFEYIEQLGTIIGYRHRDGRLMITGCTLS